ncbi:MAG: hypothetical protein J6W16_07455 [Methanobrevibacter sp.]|nr:hypothetical protein [Methanobrevibacter sp.]MBP5785400.1 hypothetical protein [Methanobrevibacter sp.]
MEKTKVYYVETTQDNYYFEKFWQLANFLKRDSKELWDSYMQGNEPNIHTTTKYTNFKIDENENFSGNRRKYFEDFCEFAQGDVYDSTWICGEAYLKSIPDEKMLSYLITSAFGLKNRIEYIGNYIFIVLPKKYCSIVTKINDYDRDSEDIGYYYMKKTFDCVIKSIKNSKKYPTIQSMIFYDFEPWQYFDSTGRLITTSWYSHYSNSLEKSRLK